MWHKLAVWHCPGWFKLLGHLRSEEKKNPRKCGDRDEVEYEMGDGSSNDSGPGTMASASY